MYIKKYVISSFFFPYCSVNTSEEALLLPSVSATLTNIEFGEYAAMFTFSISKVDFAGSTAMICTALRDGNIDSKYIENKPMLAPRRVNISQVMTITENNSSNSNDYDYFTYIKHQVTF
jgi:hypothetical protein